MKLGTNEVWSAVSLLLDTYSGAAAAYSLRKLRSGYSGNAIKVRRSVGSPAETDIGFVDNELDTSTLATFCSGTDGFVTTWFDQSGNGNDATQTTAADQPKIVSSGSVITENGKPSVQFDGSNDGLDFSRLQNIETLCAVAYSTRPSFPSIVIRDNTSLDLRGLFMRKDPTVWNMQQIQSFPRTSSYLINSNDSYLMYIMTNGTNSQYSLNGDADSLVAETNKISSNQIGKYHNQPENFNLQGGLKELIFWDSDQSSNRTGIETNINDFYSIY